MWFLERFPLPYDAAFQLGSTALERIQPGNQLRSWKFFEFLTKKFSPLTPQESGKDLDALIKAIQGSSRSFKEFSDLLTHYFYSIETYIQAFGMFDFQKEAQADLVIKSGPIKVSSLEVFNFLHCMTGLPAEAFEKKIKDLRW